MDPDLPYFTFYKISRTFPANSPTMIKIIIFAVVAFLVYRFYIAPIRTALDERKAKIIDENKKNDGNDGDYVDYEEIK